ncbi:MAG: hypothetical protein ACI4UU_02535 [Clostridia bacterium]
MKKSVKIALVTTIILIITIILGVIIVSDNSNTYNNIEERMYQ